MTFLIEIRPKKASLDPLAASLRADLLDAGQPAAMAVVETARLFRLEGAFTEAEVASLTEKLLIDPVVEVAKIEKDAKKPAADKGVVVDIWPKPGVTDPVGETVEKGLRDLGFPAGFRAASGLRYYFPTFKEAALIKQYARKWWANELVHDIRIEKH